MRVLKDKRDQGYVLRGRGDLHLETELRDIILVLFPLGLQQLVNKRNGIYVLDLLSFLDIDN